MSDREELFVPGEFLSFTFHTGHDIHGRSYVSVKFENGREIDIDLSHPYTLESFGRLLEKKNG